MSYDQFDADKEIYNQDGEFYRYQDQLRWGRFQTIIVLEGAWLAALFGDLISSTIGPTGELAIVIFGFLLVFILCVLSLKDEVDANRHMDRLSTFERKFWHRPLSKFTRAPTHHTIGDNILYPLRLILPSGSTLTVATVGLVTLFNLGILWQKAGHTWAWGFIILLILGSILSWILSQRCNQDDQDKNIIQPDARY